MDNDIRYFIHRLRFLIDECQEVLQIENLVQKISQIKEKKEVFINIFKRLQNQKHGALMIISGDAKKEAMDLCNRYKRGTLVEPLDLADEENLIILDGIGSVDGAILVDFQGYCHGISVILDGNTKIEGNLGRGSRYNSSTNYIAGEERYAVIVSEDKDNGIEVEYGKDFTVIPRES